MPDVDNGKKRESRGPVRFAGYFGVLLVMIVLTDILDNFATNIGGNMTSSFITEFFVNGTVFGKNYDYQSGLALHNTISLFGYVLALLAPFYKSLADRIGRKPLLALSALGMSGGLLIIFICRTYPVFLIGSFMLSFFIGSDIQILYVLEEAPKDKRATIYSLLKGLGGLSSVGIPMMRAAFMKNDPTRWRSVYLAPGLYGLAVTVLVILLVRETRVFLDRKSGVKAEEEKPSGSKPAEPKGGIIRAIRYIFRRKDLRALVLIKMLFDAAIVAMTNYESIMHRAGMSTGDITTAEYFYPFLYCGAVILSGFLADRIGRRKTVLIFGSVCAAAFAGFILAANKGFSPALVGTAYGLYLGGYWIGRDYMEIISTEMVPTQIRASIMGAEGLLVYVGMAVGFAFINGGMLVLPLWLVSLVFALPCIVISVILLRFHVKETMGVDYEAIGEGGEA